MHLVMDPVMHLVMDPVFQDFFLVLSKRQGKICFFSDSYCELFFTNAPKLNGKICLFSGSDFFLTPILFFEKIDLIFILI